MPLTSDQLNQLISHLKEAGPYILATNEDADFYRRSLKNPIKEPEKIKKEVAPAKRPPPKLEHKETPIAPKIEPLKPVQESPPPAPLPKKAPSDFREVRNILSIVAPELNIIDEIPNDEIAQKIEMRWKTKNQSAPISILMFQEPNEQRALLEEISRAIDIYFGPAKIVHAEKIEKDKQWGAFLSCENLKMIVVCDYTLWQLNHLLEFYKEVPANRSRVLGKVPLFLLPDLSLYLKDPELKRSLWNALKEKCASL